jgi:hypothetical protein
MRLDPGNHGIATGDDGADHRAAHFRFAAVKTVDAPVGISLLSTAFSLNCNPRLDFRTHSNLEKSYPLPRSAA